MHDESQLLTLRDAVAVLPRKAGKSIHVATIHRWATRGLRGVILETVKIGGVRMTSIGALDRFFHAVTAESKSPRMRSQPRPRRPRDDEIARAHRAASSMLQSGAKTRTEEGT